MKRFGTFQKCLALSVVSVLILSGCGSGSDEQGNELTSISIGLSDEPGQLAPASTTAVVPLTMDALVHAGLTKYNTDGEVEMNLAKSIDTDDHKVFHIVLKDGLKFADGTPLTAENVKESFSYLSDPDSPGATIDGVLLIDKIDVQSDTELTFMLEKANNAFLQYLAVPSMAVYPSKDLEDESDDWKGAGPFTLKEYNEGRNMVLEKNENYYDADSVKLNEVNLDFYPDNTAQTNALVSGEVDMIDYVPWESFEQIDSDDNLVLDSQNGPFMYLMFNTTGDSPFANPLLRQAVAYAVNRQNTVNAAFNGNGEPTYGVAADEDDPAYDPAWTKMYEEDMDHARELLKESGFDTSKEINFLANSQYKFHEDNALPVLSDLKKLGLKVKFDSPDWATRQERAQKGDYDISLNGTTGRIPGLGYLQTFINGANMATVSYGYKNKKLENLFEQGMAADSNEKKKEAFDKAREEWTNDPPIVMLNQRGQAYAYTKDVQGFSTLPGFQSFYSGYSIQNIK